MPEKPPKIACADCGRESASTVRVHAGPDCIHHLCGRCAKSEKWKDAPRAEGEKR